MAKTTANDTNGIKTEKKVVEQRRRAFLASPFTTVLVQTKSLIWGKPTVTGLDLFVMKEDLNGL